jgi:hypothetical protein
MEIMSLGSAHGARPLLLRRLMIRCPVTGTATDSGFEMSEIPSVSGRQALADCPECGQDHHWRIEDAFLD